MRNKIQQDRKNTIRVGQPKMKSKKESTRGNASEDAGLIARGTDTIEGDLKSVLSLTDSNIITEVNMGRRLQQISPKIE